MRPDTEQELAEALRGAAGSLRIVGGGTRAIGRVPPGDVLETGALAGISLYEPGALTMIAAAGTPLAEIKAALASDTQRVAFEPPDMRRLLGREGVATIGGVVAANASGPRRIQVGACRDHILGLRFVDGMGRVIRNGGRVMKNVTGYDLVKLLCGSHGSLGVLSEISFKVLPAPETQASLCLHGLDEAQAVAAMAAALGSPYEVTGAAHGVIGTGFASVTRLRLEGFSPSVAYRLRELARLLAPFGEAELEEDASLSRLKWQEMRDVTAFADHPFVARLSIKPSDFAGLYFDAANLFFARPPLRRGFDVMLDWGGGLVWVAATARQLAENAQVAPDRGVEPELHGAKLLFEYLQSFCAVECGHATLLKAPPGLAARVQPFQPESAGIAALTRGLRAKFDPRGILNQGVMG
ncbi:FAD-binding protein [Pseudorhodobacter sp.]|uniref:FAD-binding protein n=1 Tax=Pseudorhodobacter sp. TaxID=1934400 RepID=UPI0026496F1E|nr:FAD-binding protein [Pseudorhodobacter sp.]MDN5786060.1 FAD-binding protein [Pseudorhodobacter sp.]